MRKFNSGGGTLYWRDTNGGVLGETDQTGSPLWDYVFFNGQRIARVDPKTLAVHYYFSDHLGTHTVVTNATGACEQDIEFYPYGGQRKQYCTTPVAQNYKFTGKEHDDESGLDNFGARYNASSMGRFMTPDDPLIYASKGDPQTWNLYSYVRNNPLNRVDPNGHLTIIVPGTGWKPSDWNMNMKLVSEAREKFHDDAVLILPWSGALGSSAIAEGGQLLRDIVNGPPLITLVQTSNSMSLPIAGEARSHLTRASDSAIQSTT